MPKITGGGSSISKKAAAKIGYKAAVTGEKTGRVTAARSKALVTTGSQRRAVSKGYSKGRATKYLVKSSGTTGGEVKGVMKQLRSGKISKGAAIKALKGGPKAGVPAGNKKKVAKAIRKAR